jgi:chromosome segregation ATPase
LKILPIINAVGCLFLVGFIFVQWHDGQKLDKALRSARLSERNTQNEKVLVEQRVVQMQVDVDTLKGSIESLKAGEELMKKEIEGGKELAHHQHTGLSFAAAHLTALEQAVVERNATITELNASLVATRKRLDEAITELKKAGAR